MAEAEKEALPYTRVAVVQMSPGLDLQENLCRADRLIADAVGLGATVIGLPEVFTVEYRRDLFASAAEEVVRFAAEDGDAAPASGSGLMAARALQHGVTIFGGVVERATEGTSERLYNSSAAYGPTGELLTLYRKIHLSCVRAGPDRTSEADVFSPGIELKHFEVLAQPHGGGAGAWRARVGLGICFDLRFDLHRRYCRGSPGACDVLAYPSAFLESTGRDHWELLLRARALDEQVFVMAPNHAWSDEQSTKMFGHAMICGPWGDVIASTGARAGDAVAVADLRQRDLFDVRSRIPLRAVRAQVGALVSPGEVAADDAGGAAEASSVPVDAAAASALAQALCEARTTGAFLQALPGPVPSVAQAYAVQASSISIACPYGLGELAGWKCGPTTKAACLKNGLAEPGRAPIFASGRWESPAQLRYAPTTTGSPIVVEAEFGFEMSDSLPPLPSGADYSAEAVWAATAGLVLCLEVCGSRLAPGLRADTNYYAKLADCANNLGVVLGPRFSKTELWARVASLHGTTDTLAPLDLGAALGAVEVRLSINGNEATKGRGCDGVVEASAGEGEAGTPHPLRSLVWLANHLQRNGLGLRKGEVVICGAACVAREKDFGLGSGCAGGSASVAASFSGLGEVKAVITAAEVEAEAAEVEAEAV